ncbi:MAG: 50S ribosomal protein L4, partial [Fidelibacterota bacterium]
GRKPWRQKGRGVARAGSTRSPIWRGGGVTFGPKPKNYEKKLPKKMKKLARKSVLSQRISDEAIMVIDSITLEEAKTKKFVELLDKLGIKDKKITYLPAELDENVLLAARNLPNVFIVQAVKASTYDLLDCEVLLFDKEGLEKLNTQLGVS